MSTQNSTNTVITNLSDGFDVAGGATRRKLSVTGADISIVGSGTATVTFPSVTSSLIYATGPLNTPSSGNLANCTGYPIMTATVSGLVPTPPNNTTTFLRGDGTFAVPSSGFADPMTTRGDIIIRNSSNVTARLAKGANTYVLTSNATDVYWAASGFSNPMIATGDLILGGASGAAGRLAIGTNTYVLTSNGTTASWAAPAGGGITGLTTTYLPKWNGSTLVDSVIFENGINVTVGVSTDYSQKFQVITEDSASYVGVAGFYAPNNTVSGYVSQLRFGVQNSAGNSAEWRYVHIGSNNADNRIDFAFNGVTDPMITYLNSGKVGINQTTPTALLHLGAGTLTANSAPLKFTTGVALTTIEDGALEYHASHLYFSIGTTRYQLDQQGGGVGAIKGTGVINFDGLPGTNMVITTINNANALTTSIINAIIAVRSTATHNTYEHSMVPIKLVVGNIINGVSFDIIASTDWRLTGTFNVDYIIN